METEGEWLTTKSRQVLEPKTIFWKWAKWSTKNNTVLFLSTFNFKARPFHISA